MRKILSLIALVALSACATVAGASTLTVSWTNPVLNTDESPIPDTGAESLQVARIEYGTCVSGAFGVKTGEFTRTRVPGQPMPSNAVNNVPTGLTCTRVLVKNVAGNESVPSNVSSTTVAPSTPKPATGVTSSSG